MNREMWAIPGSRDRQEKLVTLDLEDSMELKDQRGWTAAKASLERKELMYVYDCSDEVNTST